MLTISIMNCNHDCNNTDADTEFDDMILHFVLYCIIPVVGILKRPGFRVTTPRAFSNPHFPSKTATRAKQRDEAQ